MRIIRAIVLLALTACSRQKAPATSDASAPPGESAAEANAPATVPASVSDAYVTAATILRREPLDAQRVPGTGPKQSASNHLATLLRGEKVTLLESKGEWAKVKASDETVGWVKGSLLLPAAGVTEATLLAPADAFDRPDLLAVNARRKIDAGTLVLVVRSRELFSEVNTSSGANAWVLSDRLSTAPRNVGAAKLIDKARWLVRSGKPDEAKTVLDLARREFSDVPLVELLAKELGETPDGGAADGGSMPPTPPGAAPSAEPVPRGLVPPAPPPTLPPQGGRE